MRSASVTQVQGAPLPEQALAARAWLQRGSRIRPALSTREEGAELVACGLRQVARMACAATSIACVSTR